MATLTLVTGNEHKLREWRRLVPRSFKLEAIKLELDELQSLDLEKIIEAKVRAAYEQVGKPVVVEDVAASLESWNGLPGPFIKYFQEQLGFDALYQLAGDDKRAVATCMVAYYDGRQLLTARGEVRGSVAPMRVTKGFGFDCVFVPDGENKTYAEMPPARKDAIGHRGQAVRSLLAQLKRL